MVILEIFSLVCIYVVIAYFKFFSEQSQLDKKHDYLHLSKAYLGVGLLGSVIFTIASVIALISAVEIYMGYIFLVIAIIFSILVLGYYGYRVYYDDEKIMYRKFFESYKIIYYKEITKLTAKYDIEIKTKSKMLTIPSYIVNRESLLEVAKNHTPTHVKVYDSSEKRVKSFGDSVYRKGEFIFAYTLIYVLIVCVWFLIFASEKEEDFFVNNSFGIFLVVIMSIIACLFPIVSICSAKRAHSSKFWKKLAKICFRDGYLKDEKDDD